MRDIAIEHWFIAMQTKRFFFVVEIIVKTTFNFVLHINTLLKLQILHFASPRLKKTHLPLFIPKIYSQTRLALCYPTFSLLTQHHSTVQQRSRVPPPQHRAITRRHNPTLTPTMAPSHSLAPGHFMFLLVLVSTNKNPSFLR